MSEITHTFENLGKKKPATPLADQADANFEEYRVQLEQRMSLVASGLASSGLRAAALGTEGSD